MQASPLDEARRARRKDRTLGLLIIAVTFLATLSLSWWAKVESRPEVSQPPGPPTTDGLVGYPTAVDPVQALAVARRVTKRTVLRGFVAEAVASDGTVDLSEGPGRVRYSFQSSPGEGPQPPRAAGTLARRLYCGKQNVHLRKEGLVADPDIPDYPCPAKPTDALPEPRCGTQDVWQHAIRRGARPDRLARIEYYRARVGPAWRFDLPGTPHRFSLYGDCGRRLTPKESIGAVQ
jgi:hypothetical protein